MSIEIERYQWEHLETQLLERFHDESRKCWDEIYRKRWAASFPALSEATLNAHGRATWRACQQAGIEARPLVMALQVQVWRAVMLGCQAEFIDDLRRYALEAGQASEFAYRWLEYTLGWIEKYIQAT